MMFDNDKYITRGVQKEIDPRLQLMLWRAIQDMKGEKDYLQVFELNAEKGCQLVRHRQEVPPYEETFVAKGTSTYIGKIFVIDDGDHSTMMLAEEY